MQKYKKKIQKLGKIICYEKIYVFFNQIYKL